MSKFQQKVNTSIVRNLTTVRQAKTTATAEALASLFKDSVLRITYFDQMTHDDAAEVLLNATDTVKAVILPRFLNYYGCNVADTNTIALFYGVDELCVVRACKYWQSELITDGLLCLTRGEAHKASTELELNLAHGKLDAVTYLLPPRAIAKLAFVLPGTALVQAVLSACNESFTALDADSIVLPENDTIPGDRISPKQIARYTAEAKVLRRYAYVGHFGDKVSQQTWERLFNYKGSYPPPHGIGTVKVCDKV
jgi:hypothetical protein